MRTDASLNEAEFEAFEQTCLTQDGIGLVEYAIDMQASGCVLTFPPAAPVGGRRLQQHAAGVFGQRLGVTQASCVWNELDDFATELDLICCGADGSGCPATSTAEPQFPATVV